MRSFKYLVTVWSLLLTMACGRVEKNKEHPTFPSSSGYGKYYWDVNDERDNEGNMRRVVNKDKVLFVSARRYQFHSDAIKDSMYIICGNRIVGIVKINTDDPIQSFINSDDGIVGQDKANEKTEYEHPITGEKEK